MNHHPYPVVIGLGSNRGPGRRMLDLACSMLAAGGVRVRKRSRLYWTRPWGPVAQPDFLNAAIEVRTRLTPLGLLARCQQIERRLGRRAGPRWGPRTIDLDILLYGGIRVESRLLTLPHPLIAQRDFVLAPLEDLDVPSPSGLATAGWRALRCRIPRERRVIRTVEAWR